MSSHKPHLAPSVRVAPNAVILGDVRIGEDSCVLFNATIRGDFGGYVQIGARTNIQELACVHVPVNGATVIGNEVSVGHGAILHGCTVGNNCLIGMGSIILDGARIGNHCLVGAGALVTGKADIPDGMMVIGSPAIALRHLTEEEIQRLHSNADEYVTEAKAMVADGILKEGLDDSFDD